MIIAAGETPVAALPTLPRSLSGSASANRVRLTILRDGAQRSVEVSG